MISLADAIRLESSNPTVNTFKPWWEIWVDYTLNAFLMVVLFALAGVTISGTPGLVCLPVDTNLTSLNYATNFYANAKCTTHVEGHILIVFPYIIFAQWLLLFVLHLSWFNLPALKAFLASSFDTFQSLITGSSAGAVFWEFNPEAIHIVPGNRLCIQSISEVVLERTRLASLDATALKVLKQQGNPTIHTKKRSKQQKAVQEKIQSGTSTTDISTAPDVEDNDDDDVHVENSGRNATLVYLVDWLQYLLQFRYNLVNFYAIKSTAICLLTAIFSAGLITWLIAFQWRTAFECDLKGVLPAPFHKNSCSFPAAPYVYSMMILNAIFTILLFIFNLRALFWLAKFCYIYRDYQYKVWKGNHPLRGKPGFYDYFFCVQMLKANNAEGDVVFKTMEEAFRTFQNKTPEEKDETVSEFSVAIPEIPKHCKNQYVLTEILRELGMRTKRSNRDDLWAALANSLDQDKPPLSRKELLNSIHDVNARVLNELLEKHALFKDLINKDDHCPMFDDYIEEVKLDELREKGIKEDHYILMAYAIAYKLNVVVVRAQKSSLLYEPEKPEINQTVRFVTFIPPHYYYATSADANANTEENAGLKFLTDQIYQTELLKEVNDRWDNKGYEEYKRNLGSILPQELPYQSSVAQSGRSRDVSLSELDTKDEGLRHRVSRSKSDKKKIEHFALMEAV